MRIICFYHSLVSDWNHGNAHFLRGVATELQARGHEVLIYEPANGWSRQNLLADHGLDAIRQFHAAYPTLRSLSYHSAYLDLDQVLDGADLVLVHEWNDHDLVQRIGRHRDRQGGYCLLFHDTHHRAVSNPAAMARYDLRHYDGVLAFGDVIREIYLEEGWCRRAWTWHEAADTRVFRPQTNSRPRTNPSANGQRRHRPAVNGHHVNGHHLNGQYQNSLPANGAPGQGDIVWVGNWGDEERTAELYEFLIEPVKTLGLKTNAYGVRYPPQGLATLVEAGIRYAGWIANYKAPAVFAGHRVTVHIPRRPYSQLLPGIPTIRPFEALACAIPLISAPWRDSEGLFTPGRDYLTARNGDEMKMHLRAVLNDPDMAAELSRHGLATILDRHTCAHRVDELLVIYELLRAPTGAGAPRKRREEIATI
jgi:spore maturation protein CgeB